MNSLLKACKPIDCTGKSCQHWWTSCFALLLRHVQMPTPKSRRAYILQGIRESGGMQGWGFYHDDHGDGCPKLLTGTMGRSLWWGTRSARKNVPRAFHDIKSAASIFGQLWFVSCSCLYHESSSESCQVDEIGKLETDNLDQVWIWDPLKKDSVCRAVILPMDCLRLYQWYFMNIWITNYKPFWIYSTHLFSDDECIIS